jgi:hypothetical protein
VAEVVEPDVPESDVLGDLGERMRKRVRVHWTAIPPVYHQVGVLPRFSAEEPSLGLFPPGRV